LHDPESEKEHGLPPKPNHFLLGPRKTNPKNFIKSVDNFYPAYKLSDPKTNCLDDSKNKCNI